MTMLTSMVLSSVIPGPEVLGPGCWVPVRRALPRGPWGWSPADSAARARSRPRPKIQDPRPDSRHPLDDRRPEQAGDRHRQLLPEADRPLVPRVRRADVGQLAGLDEVVLVAERHLV